MLTTSMRVHPELGLPEQPFHLSLDGSPLPRTSSSHPASSTRLVSTWRSSSARIPKIPIYSTTWAFATWTSASSIRGESCCTAAYSSHPATHAYVTPTLGYQRAGDLPLANESDADKTDEEIAEGQQPFHLAEGQYSQSLITAKGGGKLKEAPRSILNPLPAFQGGQPALRNPRCA